MRREIRVTPEGPASNAGIGAGNLPPPLGATCITPVSVLRVPGEGCHVYWGDILLAVHQEERIALQNTEVAIDLHKQAVILLKGFDICVDPFGYRGNVEVSVRWRAREGIFIRGEGKTLADAWGNAFNMADMAFFSYGRNC